MNSLFNDFVIHVATANGSGSQSSNNILVRALFRMGIPVGGKNMFPSNIQGLPTWFTIRAHPEGYVSRKREHDLVVAMNAASAANDCKGLKPGGLFLYNSEIKIDPSQLRGDVQNIAIPFREIVSTVTDQIKLKKLLTNMIYVGVLAELLEIPQETLDSVIVDNFAAKAQIADLNRNAISAGRSYAQRELKNVSWARKAKAIAGGNSGKILIDGNSAAAIGLLFGGCTVIAWYPITPSSSLVETFQHYAELYRKDQDGKHTYAVLQAEDELASISMVIGAGWAGARAMTATSGPGVSLMGEAVGLAYFAEVPAVIWNVQRVGPSTGLPTRTMQGDVLMTAKLSHGDTNHVMLFPANPSECFTFGQTAFDLAERLQTPVFVMSDLDLGMNLHMSPDFAHAQPQFDRGKVLSAADLERLGEFARYKDIDGDGIGYRTLPGTEHPLAAYFARGTGHDEHARYSEDAQTFKNNLDRLKRKFQTARQFVPEPVVDLQPNLKVGIIAYGTSDHVMREVRATLSQFGVETNYLRLRAWPPHKAVEQFLDHNERIYVVEQNRDAQMLTLLRDEFPNWTSRLRSVVEFDGLPLDADLVLNEIRKLEAQP